MPQSRVSPISPATAFLLKLTNGGVCEHCGGQCTWDHLELHYVPGGTIAPDQGNTYLILCRPCHWYIHAMMISPPQQRVLAKQRAPGRKRIFHSILRGKKNLNILSCQRNPLNLLWPGSGRRPSIGARSPVN